MDKKYLQDVYDYLDEQRKEHYFATKKSQKGIIEDRVRSYSHSIEDELYLMLNEGSASGLFRHGSFESDLSSALRTIKNMLDNE